MAFNLALFLFAACAGIAQSVAIGKGVPAIHWSALSVVLGPVALVVSLLLPEFEAGEFKSPQWLDTLNGLSAIAVIAVCLTKALA